MFLYMYANKDVESDLNCSDQNEGGEIYDGVIHTFSHTWSSLYN